MWQPEEHVIESQFEPKKEEEDFAMRKAKENSDEVT